MSTALAMPTDPRDRCSRGSIVQGSSPPAVRFCLKAPHPDNEDHESVFRGVAISWTNVREDGNEQ